MTAFTWKTAGFSGNFETAGNWTPTGGPPGSADDALLTATGTYTVTTTISDTVNTLQTAVGVTLAIDANTFTIKAGTGAGVNAGTISLGNSGVLDLNGAFDNTGAVDVSSYNPAGIVIGSATSLTGGGQVQLVEGTYAASNSLTGATGATVLTNVDNTISGAGTLGGGTLTLVNQAAGVIDATGGSHQLILNTGAAALSNAGLIEATGAAGLVINSTTINNASTGVIEANGSGVFVSLGSTTVAGGTLKTAGGGYIQTTDQGSVLDGTASTVNNQGTLDIAGTGTTLSLKGAVNNTGALSVISYNRSELLIAANTTLSGGGQVILNEGTYGASNLLTGSAGTISLTNVDNTISGVGALGGGSLTLVNEAAGVIDATGASHQLVLNTGTVAVANSGLIEATGAAGLSIVGTTINDTTGGVLLANNSVIDLTSADIVSGPLETLGTGSFQTTDGGSKLDGTSTTVPLYVLGSVVIGGNGTSLEIDGKINLSQKVGKVVTNGTITITSYNASSLIAGLKGATLTGSQVIMTEETYGASNQIIGIYTAGKAGKAGKVTKLTNASTIVGVGSVGANLTLTNSATGVIDATGASHALVLSTGNSTVAGSNIVKNSGLIESTNPTAAASVGGLKISGTIITNSGTKAIIEANGAATHVDLASSTIQGGTLKTLAGGYFQTLDSGSTLDGSTAAGTVNNQATIVMAGNGTSLSLKGAINNTGVFSITSYNASGLIVAANTTLSGKGAVTMNDGTYGQSNQIVGVTAATTLTNVDNTISGSGSIGNNQALTLINEASGVIDATGGSHQLVFNTGASAVTNAGLIEATGAAGLRITGSTINNGTTGIIKAVGSHIDLASATIVGGTLIASGADYFETLDGGSVLDGSTAAVNNQATIDIANSTALSLKGAINNTGTFSVLSYNPSAIIIAANTTLSGGGAVTLNEGTYGQSNELYGATAATTLTNTDNTISGTGQLGNGQLTLINSAAGVIDATGGSHGLVINTGAVAVTNAGLIEATGSAGLSVSSAVANSGTIEANGGNVTLSGAITGGGTDQIAGAYIIEAGAADSNIVSFSAAASGELKLDQAQLFTGTVTGFATGKTIDLANVARSTAILNYSGNTTSGTLTVTDGTTTATIKMTGNYTKAKFGLGDDGTGHTDVTYNGTGLAVQPGNAPASVNQMAAAMAAMGGRTSASAPASASANGAGGLLLATPHAA